MNTVNTVGVMGKGIALQFRERFPGNYKAYRLAAEAGGIGIGRMFVHSEKGRCIINFPTKQHYRYPSKLEYIKEGLIDLRRFLLAENIQSVALPPLGVGNGRLRWTDVKPMIDHYLGDLGIDIEVFEPNPVFNDPDVASQLVHKSQLKWNTSAALLGFAVKAYSVQLSEISYLELQKLGYFLQKLTGGGIVNGTFAKGHYGPFAKQLRHPANRMAKRIFTSGIAESKPYLLLTLRHDYHSQLDDANDLIDRPTQQAIEALERIISGFQAPHEMELLATVDFVMWAEGQAEPKPLQNVIEEVHAWSPRKKEIMDEREIGIAYHHLAQFSHLLNPQPAQPSLL